MVLDKIGAGDLRVTILLKKRTKTKNNFGEEISTYTNIGLVWAKIKVSRPVNESTSNKDKIERFRKDYIFFIRKINIQDFDNIFISYKKKLFKIYGSDALDGEHAIIALYAQRYNTDGIDV